MSPALVRYAVLFCGLFAYLNIFYYLYSMKPRLIIFDFDGTLADTRQNIVRTMQATIRRMGLAERNDAQCAATIGLTLYDGFLRLYPDMDGHAAELCVAKYREIYFEDVASAIPQLFDGVAETLHALRGEGILLAVASSRSSPSLLLFMRERAIDHLFSYILGSDSVSRHKPEPEAVEVILQKSGFNPSEAIVVGDMPVDILMARSASVRAVGVSWGNATREELTAAGADAVIDDVRELLPIVEQM